MYRMALTMVLSGQEVALRLPIGGDPAFMVGVPFVQNDTVLGAVLIQTKAQIIEGGLMALLPQTVLVAAMARAGELAQGRDPDVDAAWFSNHMRPSVNSVIRIQTAVTEALTDGMTMETEEEEDGEVDVTLEEIKKKDDPEA